MRRDFAKRKDNVWKEGNSKKQRTETGWQLAPTSNADFEAYYQMQGVCPQEEWEAMLEALRQPLPLTFRVNGSGRFAEDLRRRLESDFFSDFEGDKPIEVDGEALNPPLALPWYPDKLAWQLDFSRNQLRKLPRLEALHEFMKRETEIGSITRQEAVSMVPPLFLDVQPHHRVLDMCAAPGSKTMQLLEALHSDPSSGEPRGVVVANDADTQRCNMLAHQAQRMRSPALIVTNHEAQSFPLLWDLDPESSDINVKFDRILADVPCSGDGTIRKQPDIYRRWSVNNGNGLHMLQLRIALRGCQLLKVGARLVYSTCTFNPIEDEAVIAEVLRRTNGAMELLDVSHEIPNLRRQAGLRTWRVKDKDRWYDTWEEGKNGYKLDPSMFPPPLDHSIPLERCMRFLPHHQNTGGFFVAVLRKVAETDDLEFPSLEHRLQRPKGDQWRERKQMKKQQKLSEEAVAGAPHTPQDCSKNAPSSEDPEARELEGIEGVGGDGEDTMVVAGEASEGVAQAIVHIPSLPKESTEASHDEGSTPVNALERSQRPRPVPPPKVMPEWGLRGGGRRAPSADGPTGDGDSGADAPSRLRKQHQKGRWHGIDPIVPFTDNIHLMAMQTFYGLSEDSPITKSLIARNTESRPKRLNYISSGAKLLLQMDHKERLKVTVAGVKIFERQEDKNKILKCSYRVAQEGLPWILPCATRQVFYPNLEEFIAILTQRSVNLPSSIKMHITTGTNNREDTMQQQANGQEVAQGDNSAQEEKDDKSGAEKNQTDDGDPTEDDRLEDEQHENAGKGESLPPPSASDDAPKAVEETEKEDAEPKVASGDTEETAGERYSFKDPDSIEQLSKIDYGGCIAVLRATEAVDLGALAPPHAPFAVSCWRGRGSLNVLVSKQECLQMADRLKGVQKATIT